MKNCDREQVVALAMVMAACDMATNGAFVNAPYKIMFDAEVYIARVRSFKNDNAQGGNISHKLVVEKPMTYIGEAKL